MSHELVIGADGLARMVARKVEEGHPPPWHNLAHLKDSISLNDVHTILGTASKVTLELLKTRENDINVPLSVGRGVCWENNILEIVGDAYEPLQNDVFVDAFKPLLDEGHHITSAGLLSGGKRIWLQIKINGVDDAEIRKGDGVRFFTHACNSHDGKSSVCIANSDTRIVCSNTLGRANATASGKTSKKHTGDILAKYGSLHQLIKQQMEYREKRIAQFKQLDSVDLPKDELDRKMTVAEFVAKVTNTTMPTRDCVRDDGLGKKASEIFTRCENGFGNMGKSFWDLLNGWTESSTHNLGNSLNGETASSRILRRLENTMFGQQALADERAFSVVYEMAREASKK